MNLVFIHGWGFDQSFWQALAARLTRYQQEFVDLGFFGAASPLEPAAPDRILIGHSLGFVHGLQSKKNWAGVIAINSFARFPASGAVLDGMKKQCARDPALTLARFYERIEAEAPTVIAQPNKEKLCEGLDVLRDVDMSGELADLSVPALVLAAENDPLVPIEVSQRIKAGADFHSHASGGHILPKSDAAWCAERISQFLDRNFGT